MSYTVQKSLSVDFPTGLDTIAFMADVNADVSITPACISVQNIADDVNIVFDATLSAGELTSLDTLISNYVFVPVLPGGTSPDYQALVSNDPNNPGDYTSVAAAFADGHQSVFVKRGTYYETADVVIPDGGQIRGELPGQTAIIFLGPFSLKCDATGGSKETTGTVAIPHNSNVVTGTGTTFTNLTAGQHILLGTNFYRTATIDSDTQLTIVDTYRGNAISGQDMLGQTMYTGCVITDVILSSTHSYALYIRGMRNSGLTTLAILSSSPGVLIEDSGDVNVDTLIMTNSIGKGFTITNCVSMSLKAVNIFNSTSHGFELDGTNIILSACASENNAGVGINVVNTTKFLVVSDSVIKYNNDHGVVTNASSECLTFQGTEVSLNNGKGADISSNGTVLNCCNIVDHSGHNVEISSDMCRITSCHLMNSASNGIFVNNGADNNIITSNVITGNDVGVTIDTGSNNTILTSNNCLGNTTNNIVDNGTGTVTSGANVS